MGWAIWVAGMREKGSEDENWSNMRVLWHVFDIFWLCLDVLLGL